MPKDLFEGNTREPTDFFISVHLAHYWHFCGRKKARGNVVRSIAHSAEIVPVPGKVTNRDGHSVMKPKCIMVDYNEATSDLSMTITG